MATENHVPHMRAHPAPITTLPQRHDGFFLMQVTLLLMSQLVLTCHSTALGR